MSIRKEVISILLGVLLLTVMNIAAAILIFLIGLFLLYTSQRYTGAIVWLHGASAFMLWQLLYVIPVVMILKKRQQWGIMKGVILGAVVTALLNSGCFLLLQLQR